MRIRVSIVGTPIGGAGVSILGSGGQCFPALSLAQLGRI